MKIKKSSRRKARLQHEFDLPIGVSTELPEGVFGIIDDITPVLRPERLHATPDDRELRVKKTKKRTASKRKQIPSSVKNQMKLPSIEIKKDSYASELPDLEYENSVEVPEDLLKAVRRKTDLRTKDFSHMMMSRMLPSILALEAAQSYVKSAMRDGFEVEIEASNSILESVQHLINLDLLHYFLRRSSMPMKFRKQYMSTVVEEMAKASVQSMISKEKGNKLRNSIADLQSVIVKGMSQRTRNEDLDRQRPHADPDDGFENDPFGVGDKANTKMGHIGTIRGTRRNPAQNRTTRRSR